MSEAEHEPAWLTNIVRIVATESGLGEEVIRQHPKFKEIQDSEDAIEFVMQLEEEHDLP